MCIFIRSHNGLQLNATLKITIARTSVIASRYYVCM